MAVLLACSVGMLAYIYVGYPLLLRLLVWARGARPVHRRDVTPSISLVISAYNEAAVISKKLDNALALDYPAHLLEIVVISDASEDGTDEIVAGYASRRVTLLRQPERRGKTGGLNRSVPLLKGEVIVFSDANAIYDRDALRALARNFADADVGCVTGEARYVPHGRAAADVGERVYWDYEIRVKRLETAVGSMVGGDGALYAIRRSLWQELPDNAINDFLNPLQIVAAGWRAVYEPAAVCYEDTAGGIRQEYRRRVRIVSRSWRAVFQARGVLNPARVGLFAWCLFSHKLLRWVSGLFAALAVLAAFGLGADAVRRWPAAFPVALAVAAGVTCATRAGRRAVAMLGYFLVINAASLRGVVKGTVGRVSGVWATPRERTASAGPARGGRTIPVGRLLLGGGMLGVVSTTAAWQFAPSQVVAAALFWTSAAVLGYVYVGYPILLALLKVVARRPVRVAPAEPRVSLFIAANDEAGVIEAKIQNALAVDYPPDRLDIVVASDGSLDGTNAIVRRFAPRVQLLEFSPRRGKMATINDGLRSVATDIVILSDANTFLEPGAIRALVRNFADEEVGAVSGDVALVGDRAALGRSEDLYYQYERWVQQAESEIGSMIGADGALYAIRRNLFSPPASDTILDDMAIPMAVIRAGRRVVFEPEARAYEQGSETAREEFARKSRVIAGAIQFMRRPDSGISMSAAQVILSLISHKALRWLTPVFATSALLTSVALANASNGYAAAAAAQGALLVLGIAGCAPVLRRASIVAFAHYFCLVQAAAAVGVLRGVAGRQSVLWDRFVRTPVNQPCRLHQ